MNRTLLLMLCLCAALVGTCPTAAPAADPFIAAAVEGNRYVLVEFMSETCPACEEMDPVVDKVLADHPGVIFQQVDADLKPTLAKRYGVKCVPVYVVVDPEGSVRFNQVGMRTEQEMTDILRDAGAAPH